MIRPVTFDNVDSVIRAKIAEYWEQGKRADAMFWEHVIVVLQNKHDITIEGGPRDDNSP